MPEAKWAGLPIETGEAPMPRRLMFLVALAGQVVLSACALPASAAQLEIHYAPTENLEHVDTELLRSARARIDMAAYSLTDWPVIDALVDAHRRGVAVRIVLDPNQQHALDRLREISGSIRTKTPGPYMHLKSYTIDGSALRTGSANLSASGLKQQDNDLVIVHDASLAKAFENRFEQLWEASTPLPKASNLFAAQSASRTDPAQPSKACAIKGNINRKGERIYHVPGGRDYDRVTMKGAGERWFCNEEQAAAAGWRPAER